MNTQVKPIPDGFHTITPHLVVKGASQAIEFYQKAFGAKEISRLTTPDGKGLMHAELQIGDSILFLVDESPEMKTLGPKSLGGTPLSLHLFVADVDTAFKKAVAAGAQMFMPPTDMFWGDRFGMVTDPFGHVWSVASRKENLTQDQIRERAKAAMCSGAQPG